MAFRKNAVKLLVSVVLSFAVFAAVIYRTDWSALSASAGTFSPWVLAGVVAALAGGALLSVWRLKLIAGDLGFPIALRDAVAALSWGQIAGSFFFQIVGQLVARSAILSRRGMPSAATVTMTVYERGAAAVVSLVMAIAGGWYIFGRVTLDLQAGGLSFLKIALGLLLAFAAGAWLGWGRQALQVSGQSVTKTLLLQISRNVVISAAIQLCTMFAYVTASHAVVPAIPVLDLAAAAAVVMLAASLPISLAGWGVRELSAVFALGAVGVPLAGALMVAVLVGILSLVVVGVLAASLLWQNNPGAEATIQVPAPPIDYNSLLAWAIPLLAATAVFFQLFVPVGQSLLNVNLADPLAILGGCLFVLSCVHERRWPQWRLSWFNAHVIVITLVMTLALLHGAAAIGWTSWALTNRFLGWFVLLGYAATGALIARRGSSEFLILVRTLVGCAAGVAALELVLILLTRLGVTLPVQLLAQRIEGFSQNPNAFAFQLLLVLAAANVIDLPKRWSITVLSIFFAAIWFTSSRAMIAAVPITLAFSIWMNPRSFWRLIVSAGFAAAFVALIQILPSQGFAFDELYKAVTATTTASDLERWATLSGAIAMFMQYPIFGSGLGVFAETHLRETGRLLVIHSSPLWITAEMGAIGLLVFAVPLARIFWSEVSARRRNILPAPIAIPLIVAFVVTSSVHELLYQRLFWLILGSVMAFRPVAQPGTPNPAHYEVVKPKAAG